MADLDEAIADSSAATLEAMGYDITFVPASTGIAVATQCFLLKPREEQAESPGNLAEIEVDPAVVVGAMKGDVVIWANGDSYVVGRVVNPPRGLAKLEIRRKVKATA